MQKSVLVVDSGIGGLSVVSAIRSLIENIAITYISDSAMFPYGELGQDELLKRVRSLVAGALKENRFDAVVIACNTASTVVLEEIRRFTEVPIVGVVPPIKTAGELSKSRVIGLLATRATARSQYVDDLINLYAKDCTIVRVECPDLARLAETKLQGYKIDKKRLHSNIAPLKHPSLAEMDVIILGCTHYPLILDELKVEFPSTIEWLDPAIPVSRRLSDVLGPFDKKSESILNGEMADVLYFTTENRAYSALNPHLADFGFSRAACISL